MLGYHQGLEYGGQSGYNKEKEVEEEEEGQELDKEEEGQKLNKETWYKEQEEMKQQ